MNTPLPIVNDSKNEWGEMVRANLLELSNAIDYIIGTLAGSGEGGSGYDIGGYGDTYGDSVTVPASAYTLLSSGLKQPNTAIVGWGAIENANLVIIEDLIDRVTVMEEEDA
jgi:hypothetical protein